MFNVITAKITAQSSAGLTIYGQNIARCIINLFCITCDIHIGNCPVLLTTAY
jgi:hypothetical protein